MLLFKEDNGWMLLNNQHISYFDSYILENLKVGLVMHGDVVGILLGKVALEFKDILRSEQYVRNEN